MFIANLDKIQVLKSNYNGNFEGDNELIDYKLNIQTTFSHQNYANLEDDYKVLLQLIFKNNRKKIFEINQSELVNIIEKLKEIYSKIKV